MSSEEEIQVIQSRIEAAERRLSMLKNAPPVARMRFERMLEQEKANLKALTGDLPQ